MTSNIPIWRIKYHPNTLDEVCGREALKGTLKLFINQRNFPHLLFVGSERTGKTTLARLFSKEFLGENFSANFKLVYANVPLTSEERKQASSEAYVSTSKIGSLAGRKITTPALIQVKIKPFVQLKALGDSPFKILVVKNFEALGADQQGFRRLMEKYGSNCRMILITSKLSGIIEPIVSRCQIFLISRIKFENFKNLVKEITEKESLEIDDEVIEILFRLSEARISRAIDLIQLSSISGKIIDNDKLYEIAQTFQNDMIRSLLLISLKGDFLKAREITRKILSNYKYSSHEIFKLLLDELSKIPLSKFARCKLISLIAESDFRALDGRDDDIQISSLIAKICLFSEYL